LYRLGRRQRSPEGLVIDVSHVAKELLVRGVSLTLLPSGRWEVGTEEVVELFVGGQGRPT
jgi:hypothetical protein